jgi:hypothetical protein
LSILKIKLINLNKIFDIILNLIEVIMSAISNSILVDNSNASATIIDDQDTHSLESLPSEIFEIIAKNLDPEDLQALACTSWNLNVKILSAAKHEKILLVHSLFDRIVRSAKRGGKEFNELINALFALRRDVFSKEERGLVAIKKEVSTYNKEVFSTFHSMLTKLTPRQIESLKIEMEKNFSDLIHHPGAVCEDLLLLMKMVETQNFNLAEPFEKAIKLQMMSEAFVHYGLIDSAREMIELIPLENKKAPAFSYLLCDLINQDFIEQAFASIKPSQNSDDEWMMDGLKEAAQLLIRKSKRSEAVKMVSQIKNSDAKAKALEWLSSSGN